MDMDSILQDVVQISEAISLAIGCDVEVIDKNLKRVAATGLIKDKKGKTLKYGYVYSHLIQTKEKIKILENPGFDCLCNKCDLYGGCYYKYLIATPIIDDKEFLGIISIAAFDENIKNIIKANEKNLTKFLSKMAELIKSRARERELMFSIKELEAIFNNRSEGMIVLDENKKILHYNNIALNLLDIKEKDKINSTIEKIFNKRDMGRNCKFTEQQIINNKQIMFNVEPIQSTSKRSTLWLISFKDFDTVRNSITLSENVKFEDIITRDPHMQRLLKIAKKVAKSDSTILIMGESGTGKELLARAIHEESKRKGQFIPLNCGAIPDTLLESELFGYESGAFTGAKRSGKPGKFELADGGTLFLDEIGTMPLHLQVKLLRVLEDRRVERIGGTNAIPVNIRIIAATNENLEEKVMKGDFRKDLYYRINVIPLILPPLRERKNDIPLLIDHFIEKYSTKLKKNIRGIDRRALDFLLSYRWPGNIRELKNVIEFAINITENEIIQLEDLPLDIFKNDLLSEEEYRDFDEIKSKVLVRYLDMYGWNKRGKIKASKLLGISLATVYRWIKKYGLKPSGSQNDNG